VLFAKMLLATAVT